MHQLLALHIGTNARKIEGGEIARPFEPFVCTRLWFYRRPPDRVKSLHEWNRWVDEQPYEKLRATAKRRREHTGEDISLNTEDEELRERLKYDIEAMRAEHIEGSTIEEAAAE